MKLDSRKKFYISLAVILVALILIYSFLSDVGQFRGTNKIASRLPSSVTLTTCTDSDGGKDYYTKGYVTTSEGTLWDWCDTWNASIVAENFCVAETNSSTTYICPNGCSNGACIYYRIPTPRPPLTAK